MRAVPALFGNWWQRKQLNQINIFARALLFISSVSKWSAKYKFFIPGVLLMLAGCQDDTQRLKVEPISYAQLPGWEKEDFQFFWENYQDNCKKIVNNIPDPITHLPISESAWRKACQKTIDFEPQNNEDIRGFITKHFTPHRITVGARHEGLFTGYFQPTLNASKQPTIRYKHPVYRTPDDLVIAEDLRIFYERLKGIRIAGRNINGRLVPYDTSEEIRAGSLAGKGYEIAWVDDPIKLFFMHIQGSGVLQFEDGSQQYVSYAATNGHGYTALGKVLVESGVIEKEKISMQSIVAWLKENSNRQDEIFNLNKSYVFFRPSKVEGVVGALETQLYPLRSLAVDRNQIPLGTLLWLDVEHPVGRDPIQRLVVAQDVGGVIKGPIRGDLFWGQGDEAGEMAGLMKSTGTYYLLLPKEISNA